MPIEMKGSAAASSPTYCIRREAFERAGLIRAEVDARLILTDDEFKIEGDLITVGPLHGDAPQQLIEMLDAAGLEYFDDYFELSGNWPEWLKLFAMYAR